MTALFLRLHFRRANVDEVERILQCGNLRGRTTRVWTRRRRKKMTCRLDRLRSVPEGRYGHGRRASDGRTRTWWHPVQPSTPPSSTSTSPTSSGNRISAPSWRLTSSGPTSAEVVGNRKWLVLLDRCRCASGSSSMTSATWCVGCRGHCCVAMT